jgi:large subunit ribosomal protein L35
MPKMKTHRGLAKRVRETGTGKLVSQRANRGHNQLAKGRKAFRSLKGTSELAPGDAKVAKKLLHN